MGKILYLDQQKRDAAEKNCVPGRLKSIGSFDNKVNKSHEGKLSAEKTVAYNVASLEKDRDRLASAATGANRPPNYKTTRIYSFETVLSDFGLRNGPIVRLVNGHSALNLPAIAVVHCSQMGELAAEAILLGRTIFMSQNDFELWIKGRTSVEIEDKILLLLTTHLAIANTSPI